MPPDAADRRRITLALTPEGFAVVERAEAAAAARLSAVAAHLPPEDAQRAAQLLGLWLDAALAEASSVAAR